MAKTVPKELSQGSKTLAVIGGGLAGIASALAAADAGWRVTLFEAKRHLGGRVASIETPDGLIDNGRHLILDACTETRRLIRRLGAETLFDRLETITFLGLNNRRTAFSAPFAVSLRKSGSFMAAERKNLSEIGINNDRSLNLWRFGASKWLPGRLKFFPSFVTMPLSWGQKWRLFETLEQLRRFNGPDLAFGSFLGFDAASEEVRTRFWNPIILSALCDTQDAVSTVAVQRVIFSGVFGSNGPALTIPNVPLREIFHDKALELLTNERITIRLGRPIRRLIRDERSAILAGCETDAGEITRFDRLILAAEPRAVERLLRDSRLDDFADSLALTRFLPGAITAVHLWLNRRLTDEPIVLDGEPGQWLFPGNGVYAQILISGSHRVLSADERRGTYYDEYRDEYGDAPGGLIARITDQLRRHFPLERFSIRKGRVTTVPDAVTIPTPTLFGARPTGTTPFENFSLAGDWLETGWPSTMEGAIRSAAQFGP